MCEDEKNKIGNVLNNFLNNALNNPTERKINELGNFLAIQGYPEEYCKYTISKIFEKLHEAKKDSRTFPLMQNFVKNGKWINTGSLNVAEDLIGNIIKDENLSHDMKENDISLILARMNLIHQENEMTSSEVFIGGLLENLLAGKDDSDLNQNEEALIVGTFWKNIGSIYDDKEKINFRIISSLAATSLLIVNNGSDDFVNKDVSDGLKIASNRFVSPREGYFQDFVDLGEDLQKGLNEISSSNLELISSDII